MLEVTDHYKQNATAIIGFRSAEAVILAEDFENVSPTVICTDDGTKGTHGYVTTALEKVLKAQSADIIYACGPHPMLKGIAALAEKYHISCEVSLEERMGCGVGACLVCACKTVKIPRNIWLMFVRMVRYLMPKRLSFKKFGQCSNPHVETLKA